MENVEPEASLNSIISSTAKFTFFMILLQYLEYLRTKKTPSSVLSMEISLNVVDVVLFCLLIAKSLSKSLCICLRSPLPHSHPSHFILFIKLEQKHGFERGVEC